MSNAVSLSRRARQFSRLIGKSALTRRTGRVGKPVLTTNGDMGVTWVGHSSFLLQLGGRNVLIDPIFGNWCILLKRLRQPGLRIEDLPPIDLVLVTHAHFDHLCRKSLRRIAQATRKLGRRAPDIIVPRHVAGLVQDLGFASVREMKWWDEHRQDSLDITFVPSSHWGARLLRDGHRHFGGYVVRSAHHSVYHAGDTAYFPGFREIGASLRPELALLPIGAYYPQQFRNVHASPADAVQALLDLGSRWMMPMHYGSFRLAHEPLDEPLRLLDQEARKAGVRERVLALEEGVTRFFAAALSKPAGA